MKFKLTLEFEEDNAEIALEKIAWAIHKEDIKASNVRLAYVVPPSLDNIQIKCTIKTDDQT